MEKEIVAEYRERAVKMVGNMTLEEKVFQTMNAAPAIERLGIKSYNWWNEALHGIARAGIATVFPQAIGLAATFDEDLIETIADAISTEGRAKFNMQQKFEDRGIYKGLTFWAPNINIFRDPRWGRGQETFGEDPYLTTRMGVRFIRGIQGKDKHYLKAAACAKHYAVHSGPEGGRHSFNAVVSDQDLYETYLPAFRACVKEAEVESVMGAYNRVNGSPCCGSKFLLQELLRKKWGFQGHVVSDCGAIKDFFDGHNVVKNAVEAVSMAMNNGCDLNCGRMYLYLLDAIKQGLVKEERLNEALINLYTTKMKLGMFDSSEANPYSKIRYSENDSKEMKMLNLQVAEKSLVLLKNDNGILPLCKKKITKIGVIGPNADSRKALVGNYEGTASRYVTVTEGIQNYVGDEIEVMTSEACHLFQTKESKLFMAEAKAVCEESDVVVVCLGLDASYEGEGGDANNEFAAGDKKDLRFPGFQQQILEMVCNSGKEVVLLVMAGSAMDLSWASKQPIAILQCWYPGALGGEAIARILFGEKNPEGRLPITFYKTTEELPDFTDYSMEGRTYRFMKQEALYPFGYGISYTNYDYSNAEVSRYEIDEAGITLSVTVTNSCGMDGVETVQVYIHAANSHVPNPELRAIRKVFLKKGESKRIDIELTQKKFGLYNEKGELWLHQGSYEIYVGGHQPDERSKTLTGKECCRITVTRKEEKLLEE